MVWIYIIAAVVIFLLLKELIRLPTVGKYGERYVFITGCDTGFGNMLAKRLDSLGFNVFAACLTERGADDLNKVSSARLKTVFLDVTRTESIEKAREIVEKQLPSNKGIWAIVNNAGVGGPGGMSEWFSRSDYEKCLAVNLYGVIDVTRVFLPLVRRARGRIVNIASTWGRIAANAAPYVVSKYAVEGFSDCVRREVKNQGITVHILEPGRFKTELTTLENSRRSLQKSYSQAKPEVQQYYGRHYVERELEHVKSGLQELSTKTHLVIDAYAHAITAMFPRPRYLVGNDINYYYRPLWMVPEWISDSILTANSVLPEGEKRLLFS